MIKTLIFRALLFIGMLFTSIGAFAKTYKLEGMIGGQYPIVIELEESDYGLLFGRYAYKSTLQKNGRVECSWLLINPSYENPASQWDIRDCKTNPVETWYNVKLTDNKRLTGTMKNVKGKVYNIVANVTESTNTSPSMISYFKSHIGESVEELRMFSDPSIELRFEEMMGEKNYAYLTYIYQIQGDIEYSKGMYWGSGYVAHECCDPAVVWAYDTNNDSFYVWIRKDDHDYWWSESGNVPIKFRELVSARF